LKIYIAGSFNSRPRLRLMRDKLWDMGHEVVSTWLDEVAQPDNLSKKEFYKKLAIKDIAELKSANLVIVDILDPSSSGGRDTELGLALGSFQSKQVYLVGNPVGVFHELVDLQCKAWDELLLKMELDKIQTI